MTQPLHMTVKAVRSVLDSNIAGERYQAPIGLQWRYAEVTGIDVAARQIVERWGQSSLLTVNAQLLLAAKQILTSTEGHQWPWEVHNALASIERAIANVEKEVLPL